ncbi:MAG: aminotransferase class V-fold PLP-dependent enzyme [Atopobiaceae bacterium]|jgi:cysteine desulfurase family protein
MQRYLDNSSTTFPKPRCVADAVYTYMTEIGVNVGRGRYEDAYSVEMSIMECRERLVDLFDGYDPSGVVFSKNITESMNVLIKGFLQENDHVIVSSMEHNAVMRPLVQLEKSPVTFTRAACTPEGDLIVDSLEDALLPNTRAVIMTHASNVCGTVMPIAKVGAFCRDHGIKFFLDSAQSAGVLPIDMQRDNIDVVAFTGHKGLMGPQGIGGMVADPAFLSTLDPLIAGGTGSKSDSEEMPAFLPDHLEAGTQNLPGIIGLNAALEWLENTGIDTIHARETQLTQLLLQGLVELEEHGRVRLIGHRDTHERLSAVSIQTPGHDEAYIADKLARSYGIMTRVGLHCAPSAHKTLNTFPHGTIRFSLGYFNTEDDVAAALSALGELL